VDGIVLIDDIEQLDTDESGEPIGLPSVGDRCMVQVTGSWDDFDLTASLVVNQGSE
jgi:hypothetical protein